MAREQSYNQFLEVLLRATENIQEKYFRLPVTYKNHVFRERGYCYELYHQIRGFLPEDFSYTLSGEINKAGHPLIAPHCGGIIPDFLIHRPGSMGGEDNLIIIEVKTMEGANYRKEGRGLLKDMVTLQCMTNIQNGYYRGIILIFGSNDAKKAEITNIYRERCNEENVKLIFHSSPQTKAVLV